MSVGPKTPKYVAEILAALDELHWLGFEIEGELILKWCSKKSVILRPHGNAGGAVRADFL